MAPLAIGLTGIVALLGAVLVGVNVMVALGLIGALGLAATVGFHTATVNLAAVLYETTASLHFGFAAIPLFLLMGYFAMRAGLAEDLFDAAEKWFGRLPGGLAIATTLSAAAFGAACGSSIASTTVFSKLALPPMLERGYDKRMAAASIAIAGTLAVMIPPSVVMVMFAILTGASVGALLIAGVIPGLVFALLLCGATLLTVLRHPDYAPASPRRYSLAEKLYASRLAGPLLLVIMSIIVGLYFGLFTPSEAGGVGAALTLVLALIRRRDLKALQLAHILHETVKTSAKIFAIVVGALIFARFLALSGFADALSEHIMALNVNRWGVVLIIVVVYLIFGMMMDAPALLALLVPISHPVMLRLGFDPVWFGVFVVLLVEIGAVTPPVGINCFVVQAASNGRVAIEQVFAGLIPYVLAGFLMLFLLCLFPQLALYLPQTMQ